MNTAAERKPDAWIYDSVWICTRRLDGDKAVFEQPFISSNRKYVKAHPAHDWIEYRRADLDNKPASYALVEALHSIEARFGAKEFMGILCNDEQCALHDARTALALWQPAAPDDSEVRK